MATSFELECQQYFQRFRVASIEAEKKRIVKLTQILQKTVKKT